MTAPPTLRSWLLEAPFSLSLSAGFFGFYAHAGFMTALGDAGLRPERVSGASAGALVAGLWAAGLDAVRIRDELVRLRREQFWDPGLGLGLLKGRRFRELLAGVLPVPDFERCPIPVAVSAFDCWSRRTVVLGSGALAPAIAASCTYPLLFQPIWREGRPLIDGGIADRPGWAALAGERRVLLHHLPSRSRPGLPPPRREHTRAVCVEGLPAVGPFKLALGMQAFDRAFRAARLALDRPLSDVTSVHCDVGA